MLWAIFSGFVGAVLAIIFAIVVESQKKPRIAICSPSIVEGIYSDGTKSKTARLTVTNKMLPRFWRWTHRQAAVNAYGYIDFYDEQNKIFVRKGMPIKWFYEPGVERLAGDHILIRRFRDVSFLDVHPGEKQPIDVVSKYDADNVIYGWTYENYFSHPQWRNPKWKINEGEYVVGVEIRYSGDKYRDYFGLCNKKGSFEFAVCKGKKREYDEIWKTR